MDGKATVRQLVEQWRPSSWTLDVTSSRRAPCPVRVARSAARRSHRRRASALAGARARRGDVPDLLEGKSDGRPIGAQLARVAALDVEPGAPLRRAARGARPQHRHGHGVPVRRTARRRAQVAEPEQARRLSRACGTHERLGAMWQVGLMTGLRPGELAGLPWSSVDLDSDAVERDDQSQRPARRARRPVLVEGVKTEGSYRTIALPAPLVPVLRASPRPQTARPHRRSNVGERRSGVLHVDRQRAEPGQRAPRSRKFCAARARQSSARTSCVTRQRRSCSTRA